MCPRYKFWSFSWILRVKLAFNVLGLFLDVATENQVVNTLLPQKEVKNQLWCLNVMTFQKSNKCRKKEHRETNEWAQQRHCFTWNQLTKESSLDSFYALGGTREQFTSLTKLSCLFSRKQGIRKFFCFLNKSICNWKKFLAGRGFCRLLSVFRTMLP